MWLHHSSAQPTFSVLATLTLASSCTKSSKKQVHNEVSGMVTRACNPSSWEAEAAGSGVQTLPWPYSNLRPVRARGDPVFKKGGEREKRRGEVEGIENLSLVNLLNTILEKTRMVIWVRLCTAGK